MRYRTREFLVLLFAALFVVGCGPESPPAAEEESPPAPVRVEQPQKVNFGEWTELVGATEVVPGHFGRISTAVEGRVLKVLGGNRAGTVVEGQQVAAGQVIAQLDDHIMQLNRDKLAASLSDLQEQQKEFEISVQLAQLEVNRLERLGRTQSSIGGTMLVSQVDRDRARLQVLQAQSRQRSLHERELSSLAELESVKAQLELFTLRAPISGRLGVMQVATGQTITVGTLVAEVIDLTEIEVLCFAPPRIAGRVSLGQVAQLVQSTEPAQTASAPAPAGTDQPAGKVVFIAVQAHPDTGNVAIELRFPNPQLRLRAGTIQRVMVLTQPPIPRLAVPDTCVMEDQDPPQATIVTDLKAAKDADGKAIQTGKAHHMVAHLGVREREKRLMEILDLTDPDSGEHLSPAKAVFISEGANGLHDSDVVRIESTEATKE